MTIVQISAKQITLAAKILRAGGAVVYPTDTAYALGGRFDHLAVRKKIMQIKGRRDQKFTLIAASRQQVEQFFSLNVAQKKLAKQAWPGALSIVVSSRSAVRVPANSIARRLAQLAGAPLIATSANISGRPALYSARAVTKEFARRRHQPDLILDAGRLQKTKPSTIVKVVRGKVLVLRQGAVKL
ncbi:MAG: L-threonylcarbamoyladenylate synthase [Patescibacteria group bacterium]